MKVVVVVASVVVVVAVGSECTVVVVVAFGIMTLIPAVAHVPSDETALMIVTPSETSRISNSSVRD